MSSKTTRGDEALLIKVREALYHLLRCWDSANRAEETSGFAIDTSDLEDFASGLACADDAWDIDDEAIRKWLNTIEEENS